MAVHQLKLVAAVASMPRSNCRAEIELQGVDWPSTAAAHGGTMDFC